MNNASSGNNNQIQFQDGGNAKWNVGIDGSQDFGFYSYESSAYLLRINGGTKLATFAGDVTVDGTLTAQEFHTEFVSSSIIFTSGSTKFGDDINDLHSRTGSLDHLGSAFEFHNTGGDATMTVRSTSSTHNAVLIVDSAKISINLRE